MFDDNMNLEKIFFVDVLSDEEKAIKRKEEEIKDFLYSNPILRSLAIKILDWRGWNAAINLANYKTEQ